MSVTSLGAGCPVPRLADVRTCRPLRSLMLSQAALLVGVLSCVAIDPTYLFEWKQGGITNYGLHPATVLPYTLALALCGLFAWRCAAAFATDTAGSRRFRRLLHGYAGCTVALLLSTYPSRLAPVLTGIHISVATLLMSVEAVAASWLARGLLRDRTSIRILRAQHAGFVAAGLTLLGVVHLLFLVEFDTAVGFGLLLMRAGWQLQATAGTAASTPTAS